MTTRIKDATSRLGRVGLLIGIITVVAVISASFASPANAQAPFGGDDHVTVTNPSRATAPNGTQMRERLTEMDFEDAQAKVLDRLNERRSRVDKRIEILTERDTRRSEVGQRLMGAVRDEIDTVITNVENATTTDELMEALRDGKARREGLRNRIKDLRDKTQSRVEGRMGQVPGLGQGFGRQQFGSGPGSWMNNGGGAGNILNGGPAGIGG